MKISKIFTALSLLVTLCSSTIFAEGVPALVSVNKAKPFAAASVEADSKGSLTVQRKKGGPKQTFKYGQYEVVKVKMPANEFTKMNTAFKNKDYTTAASEAKRLFEKYKYLNQGGVPAQIWVDALLAGNKNNDAVSVCKTIKKFLNLEQRKAVYLAEARAYAALGKTKELASTFPTLVRFGGAAAAFVFNTQGTMAKDQGNNEDALLAYMKTFTMFTPEDTAVKPYREEAKKAIIAIFKEMGDNRAKTFVNEK